MNLSQENTLPPIDPSAIDLDPEAKTDAPFPVVGIGASAGGLEAFIQLLKPLPADTGMAFVLIQHLAPDHQSLLSDIFGRSTEMPVKEAQDGMAVEPNHVYIIAPDTKLLLVDGLLSSGGDNRPRTVIGKALRAIEPTQKFPLVDKIISRRKRVPSCDKKEGPR